MLGQRRRRWTNINTTMCQHVVSAVQVYWSHNTEKAYLNGKDDNQI